MIRNEYAFWSKDVKVPYNGTMMTRLAVKVIFSALCIISNREMKWTSDRIHGTTNVCVRFLDRSTMYGTLSWKR